MLDGHLLHEFPKIEGREIDNNVGFIIDVGRCLGRRIGQRARLELND